MDERLTKAAPDLCIDLRCNWTALILNIYKHPHGYTSGVGFSEVFNKKEDNVHYTRTVTRPAGVVASGDTEPQPTPFYCWLAFWCGHRVKLFRILYRFCTAFVLLLYSLFKAAEIAGYFLFRVLQMSLCFALFRTSEILVFSRFALCSLFVQSSISRGSLGVRSFLRGIFEQ